jgi:hypothetical protein
MPARKNTKGNPLPKSSLRRHASHCTICKHPERDEIEREYLAWKSPAKIADDFKLGDRSAVYRHAEALNLKSRRAQNLRAALECIIENVYTVKVTAGAVIQAVALYARINSKGEIVEHQEQEGIRELLDKMTIAEREAYAEDGTLPSSITALTGAKGPEGGDENE